MRRADSLSVEMREVGSRRAEKRREEKRSKNIINQFICAVVMTD